MESKPPTTRPATAESIDSYYQKELVSVEKDDIYAAINALEKALSYMPFVVTQVPGFRRLLESDTKKVEAVLARLRKLRPDGGMR